MPAPTDRSHVDCPACGQDTVLNTPGGTLERHIRRLPDNPEARCWGSSLAPLDVRATVDWRNRILQALRRADTLTWLQHTDFTPDAGDDGTLIGGFPDGSTRSMPVDTHPPDGLTRDANPPLSGRIGIVVCRPETTDDLRSAVRQWCRTHIGRDDVLFLPT